jgi:hypothetical protein
LVSHAQTVTFDFRLPPRRRWQGRSSNRQITINYILIYFNVNSDLFKL